MNTGKPVIMLVTDDPMLSYIAEIVFREGGCEVIAASLKADKATTEYPSVDETLKRLRKGDHRLDGIWIQDGSLPRDHFTLQQNRKAWMETSRALVDLDKDMAPYQISAEFPDGTDPVYASARMEHLQDGFTEMVAGRRKELTAIRDASETLMMVHPPSEAGEVLIKSLREVSSPWRDVPIVVGNASREKAKIFRKAGADAVHHTFQGDTFGLDDLLKCMEKRGAQIKRDAIADALKNISGSGRSL